MDGALTVNSGSWVVGRGSWVVGRCCGPLFCLPRRSVLQIYCGHKIVRYCLGLFL
ncbi:hypothetical protein CPT_Mansfield_009 [Escherichia phage Mansfield]|uniref:Uncharacterized protein n=1 Tax=Escherichia phage Mansfield TaxID=2591099 RepID=A0A5B9N760_9CAUD|nr:hypothetical protein CPT_Mansfield_009 [Escherichia phage Mansfield]